MHCSVLGRLRGLGNEGFSRVFTIIYMGFSWGQYKRSNIWRDLQDLQDWNWSLNEVVVGGAVGELGYGDVNTYVDICILMSYNSSHRMWMGMMDFQSLLGRPRPEALVEVLGPILESGETVSVGLCDLDLFGRFNAEHGTEAGDALLAATLGVLEAAAGNEGQVIRYGGDAFVLVLPGVEKEQAFLRLEKARSDVAGIRELQAPGVPVGIEASLSVGVAGSPDDAASAPLLVRKALDALYRAKVSGRDKVCLAREEKMVTKTTHYSQGQLEGLSRLSKRMGVSEAELLREALDDLFRKHNR